MKKIIVAIDGFSSSGKSTMAKALAAKVGYKYIDSGAMYRAVTLYAMRHGFIAADGSIDTEALEKALPAIDIDFRVDPATAEATLSLTERMWSPRSAPWRLPRMSAR